jgi:hypothetical protein
MRQLADTPQLAPHLVWPYVVRVEQGGTLYESQCLFVGPPALLGRRQAIQGMLVVPRQALDTGAARVQRIVAVLKFGPLPLGLGQRALGVL